MKICENCGACNSNNRLFCVDCSEKLGKKLSKNEELMKREQINENIENLYNESDPLHVDKTDKIIGVISLCGIAVSIILFIMGAFTDYKFELGFYALVFYTCAAAEALLPRLLWEFEKIDLSRKIYGAEDAEPSDFYKTGRKISEIVFAGFATLILIMQPFF